MQGRHHPRAPHGVVAKKQFGQNFLVDPTDFVRAVTEVGLKRLIEIGPGTGVITTRLLDFADHVTAIEFDRDLIPGLEKSFADRKNFTLVQGDILDWKPDSLEPIAHSSQPRAPYHLVGNIPFNLTTKLFEKMLLWENKPAAITFLMQKEVAEKVTQKGGKNSPLAVAAEMLGEAKLLFDVPPTAFQPQPKVMSSVIQISRQLSVGSHQSQARLGKDGLTTDYRLSTTDCWALYDFAHKLFRNPRKTLLNNLLSMMPKEKAVELMKKNGLDPMVRPERLRFEQVVSLHGKMSE